VERRCEQLLLAGFDAPEPDLTGPVGCSFVILKLLDERLAFAA